MINSSGIIIQARMGSSRLPGKMGKLFNDNLTLFEVVLENITLNSPSDLPVILATTWETADDFLVEKAQNYKIKVFRGDNQDVLSRMSEAARHYNIKYLVRICADNPFIDVPNTLLLLQYLVDHLLDYTGYLSHNGLPTIRTHWGLWGEAVSLSALEKVKSHTTELKYREHVTNYIYEHPGEFRMQLLDTLPASFCRNDIRLTIDTIDDFRLMQSIYQDYYSSNAFFSSEKLLKLIVDNSVYLNAMKNAIQQNLK